MVGRHGLAAARALPTQTKMESVQSSTKTSLVSSMERLRIRFSRGISVTLSEPSASLTRNSLTCAAEQGTGQAAGHGTGRGAGKEARAWGWWNDDTVCESEG